MKRIFIIFVLTLAAYSFVAAQNAAPSQLEQELRQLNKQLFNAIISGDKAAFENLMSDDYIQITGLGTKLTKSDHLASAPPPEEIKKFKIEDTLSEVQVRDYGDIALLNFIVESTVEGGGQKLINRYRMTEVYKRRNGKWQIVARHSTKIPEATNSKSPVLCSLSTREAPSFRELRLKMSESEAGKIFPNLSAQLKPEMTIKSFKKEKDDYLELTGLDKEYEQNKQSYDLGEKRFIYQTSQKASSLSFDGIESLSLDFYNGSIYRIGVNYDTKAVRFKDPEEFVNLLSEKLGVSKESWVLSEMSASLRCSGFTVFVIVVEGVSSFHLTDLGAADEITAHAKRTYVERKNKSK
jgi:uncharacterized protein (TIGR02246 family)